jgi:hypothetical protein
MKPLRSIAAFAMAGLVAAFMMAGLTGTLDVAAVAAVPAVATAPIHASAGSMVRPSHPQVLCILFFPWQLREPDRVVLQGG